MQIDMEIQSDVLGILNAYNYWDEIAFPNWIAFTALSTPRNALNLAYSLWHLLDWIRLDKRHAFIGQSIGDVHEGDKRGGIKGDATLWIQLQSMNKKQWVTPLASAIPNKIGIVHRATIRSIRTDKSGALLAFDYLPLSQ